MSEPKRTGMLELLRSSVGCQFVIPVYQRNYTWKADDQVKQYLFDLENVLNGNYQNHFLGIIIYLEKSLDFSAREYSVIDGQQRLTTTFLIIYAIKKIFEKNGDSEIVNQMEGQYLTNPFSVDQVKYKLKPLVSDDNVYRCIIENRMDEIDDTNSNVLKNYNYISKCLENWIDNNHYDAKKILDAMEKLYVVCVPISNDDNPQKIFESINAAGAKLTSADLIRNYLLMDLDSDTQEKYYENYWKKLEDYISDSSQELEMFFRMYLAEKTYNLVQKNAVYKEFRDWAENNKISIDKLFEDLIKSAKVYDFLFSSDLKKEDKGLKVAIEDFRKVKSDLPLAVALTFGRQYKEKKIDAETYGKIISSINAYLIRRSLCDMNSQNISKLFPSVLKKVIEKCAKYNADVVRVLNQEMVGNNAATSGSYMPTDKQMMEMLYMANVYKRPALRIVLERMELDGNPAPVDLSALSIEHLMPQEATEEWLEELETDQNMYNDNLHRIGNLTLAAKVDNSKMQNFMWEYKNEVIKSTAHLTLNMSLIAIKHWNLLEIEKRTKLMIAKICELYPYPEVSPVERNPNVIDEGKALEIGVAAVNRRWKIKNKKASLYTSLDGTKGYNFVTSKMYPQAKEKEKYWFAYREKKFEDLGECSHLSLVLVCRNQNVLVIELPQKFIDEHKDRWNTSQDENGYIKHYHIVVFKNPNGKYSMLLSHPELEEIDIGEYVIGEYDA